MVIEANRDDFAEHAPGLEAMVKQTAEIIREYGPFPDIKYVHGLSFDGRHVWFASGDRLNVLDPVGGKMVRSIAMNAHAGTAFDGEHVFQIAEDRIQKIDPKSGEVLATIPTPGGGGDSGLAWAEGSLHFSPYSHSLRPPDSRFGETIIVGVSNGIEGGGAMNDLHF